MKTNTITEQTQWLGYVWEPVTMNYTDSDTKCSYGEEWGVGLKLLDLSVFNC